MFWHLKQEDLARVQPEEGTKIVNYPQQEGRKREGEREGERGRERRRGERERGEGEVCEYEWLLSYSFCVTLVIYKIKWLVLICYLFILS